MHQLTPDLRIGRNDAIAVTARGQLAIAFDELLALSIDRRRNEQTLAASGNAMQERVNRMHDLAVKIANAAEQAAPGRASRARDDGPVAHLGGGGARIQEITSGWRQLEHQPLIRRNAFEETDQLEPALFGKIVEQLFVELVERTPAFTKRIAQPHDEVAEPQHERERDPAAPQHPDEIARDHPQERFTHRAGEECSDGRPEMRTADRDERTDAIIRGETHVRR